MALHVYEDLVRECRQRGGKVRTIFALKATKVPGTPGTHLVWLSSSLSTGCRTEFTRSDRQLARLDDAAKKLFSLYKLAKGWTQLEGCVCEKERQGNFLLF